MFPTSSNAALVGKNVFSMAVLTTNSSADLDPGKPTHGLCASQVALSQCYSYGTMYSNLDLCVDRRSDVPLGTQLTWKLRTRIATGELPAGARLPGIRELAELAEVNINTVRAVLGRLEEQGLLVTEQGRGNFVAHDAQPNALLTQAAEAAAAQANAVGLDPRDLAEALYASRRAGAPLPSAAASSLAGKQEKSERKQLREEIKRLEQELAEIEPLSPLRESRASPQPRILTASELGQARDELAARLEQIRKNRQHWRDEHERALTAERAAVVRRDRRWTSGIWTGSKSADVSWSTA